uniref:Uncharacterized protein n=1 Tax=Tanacetum cinerariifolium TaxID=118510 RepID=A0A699HXS3_TANCI|nr:hypothetical protein [Tanacetum cinerariifolium]
MEEYIRLEEEKALRRGKVNNWETATYAPLSYEPTVSYLNNDEIEFRISFDESDDEDYTKGDKDRTHTPVTTGETRVTAHSHLE